MAAVPMSVEGGTSAVTEDPPLKTVTVEYIDGQRLVIDITGDPISAEEFALRLSAAVPSVLRVTPGGVLMTETKRRREEDRVRAEKRTVKNRAQIRKDVAMVKHFQSLAEGGVQGYGWSWKRVTEGDLLWFEEHKDFMRAYVDVASWSDISGDPKDRGWFGVRRRHFTKV